MKTLLQNTQALIKAPADTAQTRWLRKLGLAGFAFFFFKGMAWLMLGWLAVEQMG